MMSDSLAAINVDQLSNAVNAAVNGTQGQSHDAGSPLQTTMSLQMPTTNPVSVPNAVMVHVDRQLLSQLAFPPPVSGGEVSTIDGMLLQNCGGFQTGNSQQQLLQSITLTATPSTTSQNTMLTTQMMGNSAATSGLPPSSIQNVPLMNAVQMLNSPHSNVNRNPIATQNTPMNPVVGAQMMIPSILTSMVPAATTQVATQSTPQNALLGSPLVLSREGGGAGGLANAFMAKQGGEQMIFNIQPEVARGSNSTNSNNSVLQLVPINNGISGLANQQPANQNPMINMSIAIHLPSQNNQDNMDSSNTQKQARTIPLSQLMTGQPIPVSQIAGPIHMALEHGQDQGVLSSGNHSQFGNHVQGMSVSQMAPQSQMSIPLSQLAVAQAIPISQITTHLSDGTSQSSSCLPNNSTSQHIQIPHSVLQSFQANSISTASSMFATTTTTTQANSPAPQIATPVATPAQAPVVIMEQEMQEKSFWNLQSLDQDSQLTSELTSDLTPSLTSQSLDGQSVEPVAKAQRQTEMDLGMVSISPEGLVSSMSADDMTSLDLGATEPIENLAMPFDEEASNMWCIECNHYNPTICTTHGPPTYIPDSEIPCRAKLTLPPVLKLSETLMNRKNIRCGVIAVENIRPRSQFGPLIGKVLSKSDDILEADSNRVWKIFRNGIASHHIDISDEDQSNWMRYVKLASRSQEQNVVIHQSGGNIYFTTNKPIAIGEELRAWYSQEYARWNGVHEKPGNSFQCSQCPMQFLQRRQLSQHLGFKHPDMASRRYKCAVCPRAFVSSTKLQLHMLTHMGLKPYKCCHCGKQFSDPSNLRIHTRIHTEEKKYICDICQKAFRQKIHLVSHMTTHTGEKHLKCSYCELTFSTHSTLIQHRHSHETDVELLCDKCNRSFKTYRILHKHMKTHTSQRDFKCQSCNKGFYTRYHAKRHHQKCRGPREERDRKRERKKGRDEGGDWGRKARKRRGRGRPMRQLRQTCNNSEASLVETCGIDNLTQQERNSDHYLTYPSETRSHPGVDEDPRLGSDDRRELPKGVTRGSHRRKERTPRETLGGHGAASLDYFDGSVLGSATAELRLSSAELDQSRSVGISHLRNSSKKSPTLESASASKRQDGRPVRQRKMPQRYSPEEDKSPDKDRHAGRNQQGRARRRGVYNFNIVNTPVNVGETSSMDQTLIQGSIDTSSQADGNPETSLFNTSHALGSGILEDGGDSRGSPSSVCFSELMENASWHTTVAISALNNTPVPVEQGTSSAVGMLPMGIGLSSETATLSSLVASQSVDTDSTLDMPSSLYAARSSSLTTRSMSMQMRGELRSDVEANEQCDDEERAGTVNDNVEE